MLYEGKNKTIIHIFQKIQLIKCLQRHFAIGTAKITLSVLLEGTSDIKGDHTYTGQNRVCHLQQAFLAQTVTRESFTLFLKILLMNIDKNSEIWLIGVGKLQNIATKTLNIFENTSFNINISSSWAENLLEFKKMIKCGRTNRHMLNS